MPRVRINNEITKVVGLGIQGPPGATGATGPQGPTGPAGANGTNGTNGVGVPTGGTTGQVLAKASATNYDTEWIAAPSALDEIVEVTDGANFTILESHNGKTLWIDQTTDIDFALPDGLSEDFQVGIVGYTEDEITFTPGGATTLSPTGYSLVGEAGIPVALALICRDDVWTVIGPSIPDTVTVIYDAGWPATRPLATHVNAVGHTSAPSWLTAEDVWFEAV